MDHSAAGPGTGERWWSFAAAVLFAGLAIVMAATFLDYGITWDEEYQRIYGDIVLRWYTSLFSDRAAVIDYAHLGSDVDHFYGAAFDLVAQAAGRLSPLGELETRHLVNAGVGFAGVVGTYKLGALLGGARSGVLAAVLLGSTPAYYGHAFSNPKDIPFAALHAWVLVLALSSCASAPRVRWRSVVLLGAIVGLALGVRVAGVFVLGYVAIAWAAAASAEVSGPGGVRHVLVPMALRLVALCAIAWVILLVAWPAAQLDPVRLPLRAILDANRTGTVLPMLFDGETLLPSNAPASYLPTWLSITLPETWFIALAAAAFAAIRRFRGTDRILRLRAGVLALSVAFPIVYVVITRPVVFDAWRHFLFIAPPLAALAGHGLTAFLFDGGTARKVRLGVATIATAALLLVVADMIRLHPYQSIYFNRAIAGGLPGAEGRFELDYWGASHREGVDWLLSHVAPDAGASPVRVGNCYEPFFTGQPISRDPRGAAFENVTLDRGPEIVLAGTRFDCARRLQERGWRELHVVERLGVPLLYVLAAPAPP
jgi:hypothetical protein